MQKQWLEATLIDFNEAKAREIAKVDRLEREYWSAWMRSCEDAETITEKGKGGKGAEKPDTFEKTKQRKGQAGDPRFLAGVQWCIERRIKLFGLDEPDRLIVDWRAEAERAGIDNASEIFEELVAQAAAAFTPADGSGGDAGSREAE